MPTNPFARTCPHCGNKYDYFKYGDTCPHCLREGKDALFSVHGRDVTDLPNRRLPRWLEYYNAHTANYFYFVEDIKIDVLVSPLDCMIVITDQARNRGRKLWGSSPKIHDVDPATLHAIVSNQTRIRAGNMVDTRDYSFQGLTVNISIYQLGLEILVEATQHEPQTPLPLFVFVYKSFF